MTGATFTAYIRYLTKTTASTLTDADILMLANVEQESLAEEIATEVDEGYFIMEDKRNLEAGIRNYTYPTDFLKSVKYVSAKLDGVKTVYLREVDFGDAEVANYPLMEESYLKDAYSTKPPAYINVGTEIMVLSGDTIIDVTEGLVIQGEVYPEALVAADLVGTTRLSIASGTSAVRLPHAAYKPLAKMVSIAYKTSKDKPLPLTEDEKLLPIDKANLWKKLRGRNAVRVTIGSVPYNDGQQY